MFRGIDQQFTDRLEQQQGLLLWEFEIILRGHLIGHGELVALHLFCDGRGTFGTMPLPSQPKDGRGKVAVSRLFIQKRAGLFSPARSYKPTSAVGVDTLFTSVRILLQSDA